jgi:hypothetical protein
MVPVMSFLEYSLLPIRFSVGYADSLAFFRDSIAVYDLRHTHVVCSADGLISSNAAIPVRGYASFLV